MVRCSSIFEGTSEPILIQVDLGATPVVVHHLIANLSGRYSEITDEVANLRNKVRKRRSVLMAEK